MEAKTMASPIKNSDKGGKKPGQKFKSLLVWQYLLKHTDEDHAASSEAIKAHLSSYLEDLRNAPKADGQERIYTHGEKEMEAQKKLMENGIPVNDNTMVEVYEMCQYLNMDFSKYFGAYVPEKSGNFKSPEVFK